MSRVEGFRSPYDKKAGDLHHLGRMLDKIRLRLEEKLPEEYLRNYGLSIGLDGQLCGFLNVKFEDVEARVKQGGPDEEIVEWIFSKGLRPNRVQTRIWNEFSRKMGWNDRVSGFLAKVKTESGLAAHPACTSLDIIELREGREPPAPRGESSAWSAASQIFHPDNSRFRSTTVHQPRIALIITDTEIIQEEIVTAIPSAAGRLIPNLDLIEYP